MTDEILAKETILKQLEAHLPLWNCQGEKITRTYTTQGWKASLLLTQAVGHLAELAWHHPDIHLSYSTVIVELSTHSAGGVTRKDLELASKIEELLTWNPGDDEGTALEGTPSDPRYAYIKD